MTTLMYTGSQQDREAPARPASSRPGQPWMAFVAGLLVGVACLAAAKEAAYVNWRRVVPPVDQRPLLIRADAKGDGRFGAPRSGSRVHEGVDVTAPIGSPVRAARSGRVVINASQRGMGRYLVLQHSGGVRSLYGHLETTQVALGERVRQGQIIATVGKTGNARSRLITPHLHFEVSRKGEAFDPAALGLVMVEPPPRVRNAGTEGPND